MAIELNAQNENSFEKMASLLLEGDCVIAIDLATGEDVVLVDAGFDWWQHSIPVHWWDGGIKIKSEKNVWGSDWNGPAYFAQPQPSPCQHCGELGCVRVCKKTVQRGSDHVEC